MVPLAFVTLTVPFYLMSVLSEYLMVRRFFPDLSNAIVWTWVTRANALSYAFLLAVILFSVAYPGAFEWAFGLFGPVAHALFGLVYWLIRGRPLPF